MSRTQTKAVPSNTNNGQAPRRNSWVNGEDTPNQDNSADKPDPVMDDVKELHSARYQNWLEVWQST